MKKILSIIYLSISSIFILNGQTVEIGQSASQIKQLIEWVVKNHNHIDSYGNTANSRASYDVSYNDGEINDVILCYDNQYISDYKINADFCEHYIMEFGKLAYTLTEYENISTKNIISTYNYKYGERKLSEFYFSDDYKHYSKIYLAKNGRATVEWRKTDPKKLPINIGVVIENKLNEELINKQLEDTKKEKERIIQSKTYNLAIYDTAQYNRFINQMRNAMINAIDVGYDIIEESNAEMYVSYDNIYKAHYKLVNHGRESINNGSNIIAGLRDIRCEDRFSLLSGYDNNCSFLKRLSVKLNTIFIENVEVLTEVKLDTVVVNYTKGITKVKVKKGKIFFIKFPPPLSVQEIISKQLKTGLNETYGIRYEVGEIMGMTILKINKF